tara:strand:+ start:3883 stop:4560 length:678 start_codon:yes stop_codon:yes gene_type:complete
MENKNILKYLLQQGGQNMIEKYDKMNNFLIDTFLPEIQHIKGYMFHAGSALMIYRDKSYKPVNHDMDIDIQFPFEEYNKVVNICKNYVEKYKNDKFLKDNNLIFTLDIIKWDTSRKPLLPIRIHLYSKNEKRKCWSKYLPQLLECFCIDIFFYRINKINGKNIMNNNYNVKFSTDIIFPLKYIPYRGFNIPIPNNIEKYCCEQYGSDWRIPQNKGSLKYNSHLVI